MHIFLKYLNPPPPKFKKKKKKPAEGTQKAAATQTTVNDRETVNYSPKYAIRSREFT